MVLNVCPADMGHDLHFLSRLDRVSLPHVELAMSLYNDTPLLQCILDGLHLPDSTERVAISLGDPVRGPFLVVTRSGRFVTCLGEDMSPGSLHVVTRSHLDSLSERVAELRARMAVSDSLTGKTGNVAKLLKRLFTAGGDLTREEFIAISAWQPLLRITFLRQLIKANSWLQDARIRLRKVGERPKPPEVALLREYWNELWAIGHLILLFSMDARELIEAAPELEALQGMSFSWPAVRQGFVPVSLRGAWAAGKVGKLLLSGCKDIVAETGSVQQLLTAVYSLMAMAGRHSRLRGEIRKALRGEHRYPDSSRGKLMGAIVAMAGGTLDEIFSQSADARPLFPQVGGEIFIHRSKYHPEVSGPRYADPSAVPEQLALAAVANGTGFDMMDSSGISHALVHLPWLACAQPEDLYFPAEVLPSVRVPFMPEIVLMLLRQHRQYEGQSLPARAAQKPGRNELCPCGSGQKYKRCCADKEESDAISG